MLTRRGLLVVAGVAVLLLLSAFALLNNGTGDDGSSIDPGARPPTQTPPTSGAPIPRLDRGPQPPSTGTWTGAWVRPDVPTQSGLVAGVTAFESALGRRLDVVQVYHQWDDDFPTEADKQFAASGRTLMISWAGTDTRAIVTRQFDDLIRARAREVKALGVPVLLRFRWEMNRPNLQGSIWSPADYVAAWKHVREIFTSEGATNAGWVWCPLASGFDQTNGPAYYPGDDQVEWLCTDVYPGPDYLSFGDVAAEFMTWAAAHDRPVIIGEYGAEDKGGNEREQWLRGVADYARQHPQIKGLVYFDARHSEKGRERDFTLQPGTAPLQAYREMVLDPYFDPQHRGG